MITPQEEPTVESRLAFRGRLINVRVDTVRLSGGALATREIVEHGEAVCIVPLDAQGNVILVQQFRKATGEILLEAPAGGVEKGEVSEAAVLRELQEETGYTAGKIQHLATFWTTPGFCTELMHAYLATELTPGNLQQAEDERIRVIRVPMDRIPDMIRNGEIRDGKSIAALLMALYLYS